MRARSAGAPTRPRSADQSIGIRSTKVPVTSVRRRDASPVAPVREGLVVAHPRDEAPDRALKSHSSRIGCSAGHAAKLCVAIVQFDVSDDELAVGRVEPREGRAIPRVVIDLDRSIERRGRGVRERDGQGLRCASPGKAPMFIADAVADGGAKVRAQRIATLKIERVEPSDRPNHDVVHQIGCVGVGARPAGQSAVRPAMQSRQKPTDELG
jgi:hypothetical protein